MCVCVCVCVGRGLGGAWEGTARPEDPSLACQALPPPHLWPRPMGRLTLPLAPSSWEDPTLLKAS